MSNETTTTVAKGEQIKEGAQLTLPTQPPAPSPAPAPTSEPTKTVVHSLLGQILTTKRAHASPGDQQFRLWLNATLKDMKTKPYVLEENICVDIGKGSKTMFSCHIDTVHSHAASDGTRQKLAFDAEMGHLFLESSSKVQGACLGADDGAGIYIMLRMIEAKVPGTYVFHVGEEKGGIGSNRIRGSHMQFLKRFDRAVAFDRANTDDVIYRQGGTACASFECADTLAKELNKLDKDFQYNPSDKGVFTDTKVYACAIPECLNLSVGYMNQHSKDESLDVVFLEQLITACIKLKWETLPVKRDPSAAAGDNFNSRKYHHNGYNEEEFEDFWRGKSSSYASPPSPFASAPKPAATPIRPTTPKLTPLQELEEMSMEELLDVANSDPDLMVRAYMICKARMIGLQTQVEVLEDMLQ